MFPLQAESKFPEDSDQENEEDSSTTQIFPFADRLISNYVPSMNSIDVSKDKDGMVYKEITFAGHGDEFVHKGALVSVHYKGYLDLDGELCFGTSLDEEPLKFVLGDAEANVVKGWHFGVATMKKGEVARLIIHPDLAYGPKGHGKTIPGNTTVFFEIELLDWEGEDISTESKGEVLRKRIRNGPNKHVIPNEGALIKVALEGSVGRRVFDKRVLEFTLGEGVDHNICLGVEDSLYKFVAHEVSRLTIQPSQAFGSEGSEAFGIPSNTTVTYVVELQSIQRAKEVWEMDGQEKLEWSRIFKEKANNFFKHKKFRVAARYYKRIIELLTAEAFLVGDDEEERKSLICTGHLSRSLCYLKLNENEKALHSAEDGLKFEPNSEKGLFRKGLANLALNDPVYAKADFEKVLSLVPTNKAAQVQLQLAIKKMKEVEDRDRIICARMFAPLVSKKDKSDNPNILGGTKTQTRASPV